jgi:hypothetical protein
MLEKYLSDRAYSNRIVIEFLEYLIKVLAEDLLDDMLRVSEWVRLTIGMEFSEAFA